MEAKGPSWAISAFECAIKMVNFMYVNNFTLKFSFENYVKKSENVLSQANCICELA
jgi:hypothetical protein